MTLSRLWRGRLECDAYTTHIHISMTIQSVKTSEWFSFEMRNEIWSIESHSFALCSSVCRLVSVSLFLHAFSFICLLRIQLFSSHSTHDEWMLLYAYKWKVSAKVSKTVKSINENRSTRCMHVEKEGSNNPTPLKITRSYVMCVTTIFSLCVYARVCDQ